MTDHPLKSYRRSQNPKLSQAQLAARLGVARLTLTRWESGKQRIDQNLVPSIAEKTGISPADLRPDLASVFAPSSNEEAA